KSVQDELKLTEDQTKTVAEASRKQMTARQSLRDLEGAEREKKTQELNKEAEKVVADTLKPEQAKRLKQISLQQQGAQAFNNPEIAKELNITDEQKQKIKTIQEDAMKEMRTLFQPGGDRTEAMKKIQELNKATNDKVMGVLTADQKTKWKEMTGEPFKGEIRFGGRPGGGN